ncbi:hypothetical protein GCM10020254_79710 [Streptomyces goshikiensis]
MCAGQGEGEEELFEFFLGHGRLVLVGVGHALTHAAGHDLEAGAVQGFGDGSELGDDILAVASGFDHGDDARELPLGAAQAVED